MSLKLSYLTTNVLYISTKNLVIIETKAPVVCPDKVGVAELHLEVKWEPLGDDDALTRDPGLTVEGAPAVSRQRLSQNVKSKLR